MRPHKITTKNDTAQTAEFVAPVKHLHLSNLHTATETLNFEQKTGFLYPEHTDKSCNTLVAAFRHAGGLPPVGRERGQKPFLRPLGRFAETPPDTLAPEFARVTAIPEFIPSCTGFFLVGQCGAHKHLKAIVCNREWCVNCGKNDSMAHRRRMSRWWSKLETYKSTGYLVVTVPAELRKYFQDNYTVNSEGEPVKHSGKKVLQEFRTYIQRKLRRVTLGGESKYTETPYSYTYTRKTKTMGTRTYTRTGVRKKYVGYENGFIRYHYFGDCEHCKGEGCEMCIYTGAGRTYNPHLNILIPETHVKKANLRKFKQEVAQWFKKRFNMDSAPQGNINYRYYTRPAQRTHKLKYVTRATFRIYDPELTKMLYRFHTGSSWGKFKLKDPTFTEAAEKGCCKNCLEDTGSLEKIEWKSKLTRPEAQKVINTYRHVENGYYVGYEDINKIFLQ